MKTVRFEAFWRSPRFTRYGIITDAPANAVANQLNIKAQKLRRTRSQILTQDVPGGTAAYASHTGVVQRSSYDTLSCLLAFICPFFSEPGTVLGAHRQRRRKGGALRRAHEPRGGG